MQMIIGLRVEGDSPVSENIGRDRDDCRTCRDRAAIGFQPHALTGQRDTADRRRKTQGHVWNGSSDQVSIALVHAPVGIGCGTVIGKEIGNRQPLQRRAVQIT